MKQEISIPEGFTATIEGDKIILTRIESEDEKIRKALIEYFNEQCDMSDWNGVYGYQVVAWLEKQGQTFTKKDVDDAYVEGMAFAKDELEKHKPAEWSKEDEIMTANIRDDLFCYQTKVRDEDHQLAEDIEKEINWFKSLKERYTWKPSDEQMHYLNWIANIKLGDSVVEQEVSKHLNELLEDLKKLRKEEV